MLTMNTDVFEIDL